MQGFWRDHHAKILAFFPAIVYHPQVGTAPQGYAAVASIRGRSFEAVSRKANSLWRGYGTFSEDRWLDWVCASPETRPEMEPDHGRVRAPEPGGILMLQMKKTAYSKYYLAAAVALATFVVYLSSFHNAFVDLDDPLYVVANPHIRSLNVDFFKWAFFDFYAANWHPLTWISHAVDYAFWGLDPSGHHLTSIILHSINAFLVVLLAIKTYGNRAGAAGRP